MTDLILDIGAVWLIALASTCACFALWRDDIESEPKHKLSIITAIAPYYLALSLARLAGLL